jgi:hypothetical protein
VELTMMASKSILFFSTLDKAKDYLNEYVEEWKKEYKTWKTKYNDHSDGCYFSIGDSYIEIQTYDLN